MVVSSFWADTVNEINKTCAIISLISTMAVLLSVGHVPNGEKKTINHDKDSGSRTCVVCVCVSAIILDKSAQNKATQFDNQLSSNFFLMLRKREGERKRERVEFI